jgi:hypothetical protein
MEAVDGYAFIYLKEKFFKGKVVFISKVLG